MYNEKLLQDFRTSIKEKICSFIIIECEGGKNLYLNKFVHVGITTGHFKCYCIELRQTLDICKKFNVNGRNDMDIQNTIKDLDKNAPPAKVIMLDPTSLIQNSKIIQPNDKINEFATLLNTDSVKKSFQIGLNNESNSKLSLEEVSNNFQSMKKSTNVNEAMVSKFIARFKSEAETKENEGNFLNQLPSFEPAKIIDYNHKRILSEDEKILELKAKSFDHNHKPSQIIMEHIKNIDIQSIVKKRKIIAQKTSVLKYLRMADRPEDTVSNPSYPKNWIPIEEIEIDTDNENDIRKSMSRLDIVE